jgi:tetratricopeptide (TPR) repeat protein
LIFLPINDNIKSVVAVKHFIYISNIRRVLMKYQKSKTSVKIKKPSLKVMKKSPVKKVVVPINSEAKFQEAYDCIHRGDQESSKKGRDILIKLVRTNPNFLSIEGDNAYYYLGRYYMATGKQIKRAIEYFTKAIKLNPKDGDSIQDRGFCWMKLGERGKALKDLKKVKLFEDTVVPYPDLDKYIAELSKK